MGPSYIALSNSLCSFLSLAYLVELSSSDGTSLASSLPFSSLAADLSGGLDAPEELTGDFSTFDLDGDGVLSGPEIVHLAAVLGDDSAENAPSR